MAQRGKTIKVPQGLMMTVHETFTLAFLPLLVAEEIVKTIVALGNVPVKIGRFSYISRHKVEVMATKMAITIRVTYKATKNLSPGQQQICVADAHRSVFELAFQILEAHDQDGNDAIERPKQDNPKPVSTPTSQGGNQGKSGQQRR